MRHPVSFVLPLFLMLPVSAVQAQVLPDSGARVRITGSGIPRGKVVGVLERITGDTIVVGGQTIGRSSIGGFEVSDGRRSQWRKGLVIGFLGGAVTGALSAAVVTKGINWSDGNGDLAGAVGIMAAIGSGAGLVVGGVFGALTREDRWRKISLDRVRLAPIVRGDGTLGVSMGLTF